jgi:hypothetical protein
MNGIMYGLVPNNAEKLVRALQPSAGNRLKKEPVLGFLNNLWGLRTE